MYRVLVFGMTENPGGVESFLMNYYRRMDLARFHFDFLCNSYDPVAYEDEIHGMGGCTVHFTSRRQNPLRFRKELEAFFGRHAHDYQAIWVNVNSLANIDYLKLAKKYGIPRRIIHSHNAQNMDTRLRGLLHEANRGQIGRYATDFWACSRYAAKWFYAGRGGKGRLRHPAVIIRNAIDVEKVQAGFGRRREIRRALGWEDAYVLACVGRLHFQKNQKFAIDVLAELLPAMPDARLLLVGQGEDEAMLRAHVKDGGLEDRVHFAGVVEDVPAYLGASDFFLFPSVFEGLGIAGLEAQAAGLPTLASEGVIPRDIAVTDLLQFCPLEAGPAAWAARAKKMREEMCVRGVVLANAPAGGRARTRAGTSGADAPEAAGGREASFAGIRRTFVRKGYDSATEVVRLEQLLARGGRGAFLDF